MSEIKLDAGNVAAEVGRVALSVEAAVAGFEKARSVINGIYDDLILWERASEFWQDKKFKVRVDEIGHLRELGQISAEEESRLWKLLMDEKTYGWRNVKAAEEGYHKAMYQHSKQWIEEQTRLGKLSADEIAQAWQRVYEKFDDINIKYQAALQIRDILLDAADEGTSVRRYDSDRWMSRQDIYDGGDPKRQVEDYTRRIQSETVLLREIESGFLNGVELGAVEQTQRWREVYEYIQDLEDKRFMVSRDYIKQQAEEYAAQSKAALKDSYEYRLAMYNSELAAISAKYDDMSYSRREQQRGEELNELIRLREYYRYSVTKEGQDKYKDILSKINSITDASETDSAKRAQNAEEEVLRKKIADLKNEYESTTAQIECDKERLMQAAANTALSGISTAEAAGNSISNIMMNVNRSFSAEVESLFAQSERFLEQKVASIAGLFAAIGSYYNQAVTGAATNVSVTLNDYGDKNLSSQNAIVGYANEFVGIVSNVLRAKGVK